MNTQDDNRKITTESSAERLAILEQPDLCQPCPNRSCSARIAQSGKIITVFAIVALLGCVTSISYAQDTKELVTGIVISFDTKKKTIEVQGEEVSKLLGKGKETKQITAGNVDSFGNGKVLSSKVTRTTDHVYTVDLADGVKVLNGESAGHLEDVRPGARVEILGNVRAGTGDSTLTDFKIVNGKMVLNVEDSGKTGIASTIKILPSLAAGAATAEQSSNKPGRIPVPAQPKASLVIVGLLIVALGGLGVGYRWMKQKHVPRR